jgi:hypothetical protein
VPALLLLEASGEGVALDAAGISSCTYSLPPSPSAASISVRPNNPIAAISCFPARY